MASANFTVNGNAVPPEVAVAGGSLVTLALLSVSGVDTAEWSIIGNHAAAAVNPVITPAGTPLGATATFTMPIGTGQAYLIQCVINGGVDSEGIEQSSYVKTALVGVNNSRGEVPFAFGEAFERSSTHGTTEAMNNMASPAGPGDGDVVGPGGATAGNLAALDATGKELSDSGIAGADVVRRNGSVAFTADQSMGGNQLTNVGAPSAGTDAATKAYVDAAVGAGGGGGGGMSFPFTYSTTTTDSDPGAGTFRGNDATLGSSTQLFFDDVESGGTTVSTWFATWDDALTSGKGTVRLQSKSDPTKWLEWPITAYTAGSGYSKITVTAPARGPGGIATTAGDTVVIFDAGASGTLAAGSVDAAALASNAVQTAKIQDGAVTGAKLSALSITDIPPVVAATTGNVALTGAYTVDGITLSNGDRYLAWKQTTASQNGVYVYNSAGAHARATDFDATADFRPGVFFAIASGTLYGGRLAALLTTGAITVGATNIAFAISTKAAANPGDDGKMVIASAGDNTYVGGTQVGQVARWNGTSMEVADPDFGARPVTMTGTLSHGTSPATAGDWRVTRGFTMQGRTTSGGGQNVKLLQWTTSDELKIGDVGLGGVPLGADIVLAGDVTQIRRTGNVALQIGATIQIQQQGGVLEFATGLSSAPVVRQAPSSSSAVTGQGVTYLGQDMNGTGSSGGPALLRGGNATGASGTRNGAAVDVQPGGSAAGTGSDGAGALRQASTAGLGTPVFSWGSDGISWFNGSRVAKQTVTGSKGANAALTSLLSALAAYGLVTDSSS